MTIRSLLAMIAILAATGACQAADMPGPIFINAPIVTNNPCADPTVRSRIVERFARAERNTWQRGFVMASLANGRLSGHPFAEPGIIHREYCMADAAMTNGAMHTVYFAIEFGVGFASIGNYVDFCVLGLDPWRVHDADCRTVK
jgi:hypothetical protein